MTDDDRAIGWDSPTPEKHVIDPSVNLMGPTRCKYKHSEHRYDEGMGIWLGKSQPLMPACSECPMVQLEWQPCDDEDYLKTLKTGHVINVPLGHSLDKLILDDPIPLDDKGLEDMKSHPDVCTAPVTEEELKVYSVGLTDKPPHPTHVIDKEFDEAVDSVAETMTNAEPLQLKMDEGIGFVNGDEVKKCPDCGGHRTVGPGAYDGGCTCHSIDGKKIIVLDDEVFTEDGAVGTVLPNHPPDDDIGYLGRKHVPQTPPWLIPITGAIVILALGVLLAYAKGLI